LHLPAKVGVDERQFRTYRVRAGGGSR
jgi:hypothetical protein